MLPTTDALISTSHVSEVDVRPIPLDVLNPFLLPDRVPQITKAAARTKALLAGRTVFNVNSTATGGGVAELVQSMVGYAKGAGLDVRWLVIRGDAHFFQITKRIHNRLHGQDGDGGPLGDDERRHYEAVIAENARDLKAIVKPGDAVILHDPQTAGLVHAMKEAGAFVIWRSHIGREHDDGPVGATWDFLRPYITRADTCIFSMRAYLPSWLDPDRVVIMQPSIDPASSKNEEMPEDTALSILQQVGLMGGPPNPARPTFRREGGNTGEVIRRVDSVQAGPLPVPEDPVVAQVARWDRLKDMEGVMRAFARVENRPPDARLFLVGPSMSGVSDDPEAGEVLDECILAWRALPQEHRERIHLICVPMDDREENAAIVNAIQRHATVIVQKSLAEGFGLTVTEAMWKGKPVIASGVGGITEQIIHGKTGVLLPDPNDIPACARAIGEALRGGADGDRMGAAARERVRQQFLSDRQLLHYADLLAGIATQQT